MNKSYFSDKWKIATIVLLVALLVVLIKPSFDSPQKVGENTINFINQNLLGGETSAGLKSIEKSDIKGLYNIKLDIQGQVYDSFVSSDGKYLFADGPIDMSTEVEKQPLPEMLEKEAEDIEGGFKGIIDMDVCMENDKPIVYFFGSENCPYCAWEKPLVEDVISQFGDAIDYRERYDGVTDSDVLLKYGEGAVPMVIAGCKYYRTGAGQNLGEDGEKEALKAVFCRATGGVPSSVCGG